MGKKKKQEPPGEDIPAWFMTYSDVITLLMTFFILLMTFSSTEPENLSRMQAVSAGGGGSSSVARKQELAEQDGLIVRVRPSSSRIAKEGSEEPPEMLAPAKRSVSKGIDALDEEDPLGAVQRFQIDVPLSLLRDKKGEGTSYARGLVRMIGKQMVNVPVDVRFLARNQADADTGLGIASAIYESHSMAPGRLSVTTVDSNKIAKGHLGIRITRIPSEGRKK